MINLRAKFFKIKKKKIKDVQRPEEGKCLPFTVAAPGFLL